MGIKSTELCFMIREYLVYKNIWIPLVGKVLTTKNEEQYMKVVFISLAADKGKGI